MTLWRHTEFLFSANVFIVIYLSLLLLIHLSSLIDSMHFNWSINHYRLSRRWPDTRVEATASIPFTMQSIHAILNNFFKIIVFFCYSKLITMNWIELFMSHVRERKDGKSLRRLSSTFACPPVFIRLFAFTWSFVAEGPWLCDLEALTLTSLFVLLRFKSESLV